MITIPNVVRGDCPSEHEGYLCCLDAGHSGNHEAYGVSARLAVWASGTKSDMERVHFDIGRDHNAVWCIWRVGFSGRSVVKTLAATNRAEAEAALAAFKTSEAA